MSMSWGRIVLPGPHGVWWGHVTCSIQWVVSHFWIGTFNDPCETPFPFLCTEMGNVWVGGCSVMMSRTPVDSARHVGEERFNFLWVGTCSANTIPLPPDRGGGDFPVPLRLALTVWFTLLSGVSVDLTSAGALNALDFHASVISQGATDFSRLWNEPQGRELESFSPN